MNINVGLLQASCSKPSLNHTMGWWGTHKKSISEWPQFRILMEVRFDEQVTVLSQRYIGMLNHVEKINQCHIAFVEYLRQEWAHHFIHTLEMTPRSWYTFIDLRQGT